MSTHVRSSIYCNKGSTHVRSSMSFPDHDSLVCLQFADEVLKSRYVAKSLKINAKYKGTWVDFFKKNLSWFNFL